MAEVIGVDTQHHLVQSQESDLPYDYLILATGAHLFRASKRAPRSCCTGPATNGGMRPIPGREPRGWGLNASIFYCPNSTRRCGSRSCGWQSTAGKAKTTRLQYRPVPRCGSEGKPMAHTHAPSHDPRTGAPAAVPGAHTATSADVWRATSRPGTTRSALHSYHAHAGDGCGAAGQQRCAGGKGPERCFPLVDQCVGFATATWLKPAGTSRSSICNWA